MPARSSRNSSDSFSTPSTQTWADPATLRSRGTVSRRRGTCATRPPTSRSRKACTRATVSVRVATVTRMASAMATIPATLCVPLRRSRSWPPPIRRGSTDVAPRTKRAPTPFGPPNLCADTATRSKSAVAAARSSHWRPCTPSVCSTAPGARSRTTAATSASGEIVPTSLLTAMTETTRTDSSSASASASRSTAPAASTGTTRPPRCSTDCSTAWCSAAGQRATPPWRRTVPRMARLSASVPQPVKTTSPGEPPRASATMSRASSSPRRASRDAACEPLGLAKRSVRNGSIASTASGRIGVVAAWSR